MNLTKRILGEIVLERQRQNKKFGVQDHTPYKWLSIIGEEYGESCEAALELDHTKSVTEFLSKAELLRDELLQVAASAVAAIENIEQMKEQIAEEELTEK